MVPKVWPSWHAIGYDDSRVPGHVWFPKVLAWEALGDRTFDLPTAPLPSIGPIPVNLPSPAIPAGNVAGPSTNPTTEFRDKGKGKAVFAHLEPEAEGSKKRKSPLISGPSFPPPKTAMKSHKRQKQARVVKSKPMVESEDDEPTIKVCRLVLLLPVSHVLIAVCFGWSAGGPGSPVLYNSRKEAQFSSVTQGSNEKTLWPRHCKSHLRVRDSGVCLLCTR